MSDDDNDDIAQCECVGFNVPLNTLQVISGTIFTGQMTKPTVSKHWRKPVGRQRSGLNHTRTTTPCYNNTTLGNCLYTQHKGPNVTNPICLACKNCSHKCAVDCEHCHTIQRRAVLIIFPLYLQTITVTRMLSSGGEERWYSSQMCLWVSVSVCLYHVMYGCMGCRSSAALAAVCEDSLQSNDELQRCFTYPKSRPQTCTDCSNLPHSALLYTGIRFTTMTTSAVVQCLFLLIFYHLLMQFLSCYFSSIHWSIACICALRCLWFKPD